MNIKKTIYKFLSKLGFKVFTKKQKRILLRKNKLSNSSNFDSVIFFTTHKCASNFISKLLETVDKNTEYIHYDYGGLVGSVADKIKQKAPFEPYLNKNYKHLFNSKGEIYGPQRRPLNFLSINSYKKIFFLRDPRDVLISSFYSFGKTHAPPSQKILKSDFYKEREKINSLGLEKYAIYKSDEILEIYLSYKNLKEMSESCIYLKYDDYALDTSYFLNTVFNFLNISIDQMEIDKLISLADPIQLTEDDTKHKRSGTLGQWKSELSKETQKKLNVKFQDILKYWEFD